jgi:hypothetical protein
VALDASIQTGDDLDMPKVGELSPYSIMPSYLPVVTLHPGEKELIPMSDCMSTETADVLNSAHLGLQVTFRPMLWFTKREVIQDFYVKKIHKGTFKAWVWYSVPYNK